MTMSSAALGELLLDLARFLGGDQPRQLRDAQRQPGKALGEAAVMLAGEQRRRHDDRDLATGHRGDEGGAQRHLGLAEADIAADQPVHRLARGHVGERVGDRGQLVLGLGIGKAGGELLVDPFRRRHDIARPQLALGGDADQLAGDVADALLDPRLARLPGDAAEAVELHPRILGAEARQHLDVLDRDEELVVAGIEHAQAVMRRAGDVDRLQRLVAADAVIGMDDEVARRQVVDLGDELVEVAPAPRRPAPGGRRGCPARRAARIPSVAKPCSTGNTASPTAAGGSAARASPSAIRLQVGDAALAQHASASRSAEPSLKAAMAVRRPALRSASR